MTAEQILQRYQKLHSVTKTMLQAARDGDWDCVIACEQECQDILEPLIAARKLPALSEVQRQEKSQILRDIVADDARIRELTSAWMQHLQQYLGDSGRQRSVRRAYDL